MQARVSMCGPKGLSMTDGEFNPRRFELWRVDFPFEDRPDKSKIRPALVIGERNGKAYALMLRVTGNTGRAAEYDVYIDDWREDGLDYPCAVRCDKLAAIDASDVDWSRPVYGRLTVHDARRVFDMFRTAFPEGVTL